MSWINQLYETYETCSNIAGLEYNDIPPLLPAMHILLKAHVTVVIKTDGSLYDIRVDENQTGTIAPVTEESAGRTSTKIAPHPLIDKLQYLAGDYNDYMKTKKKTEYYEAYLKQLREWKDSEYTHEVLHAIYDYIERGTLIKDLIEYKIVALDDEGYLLEKWKGDKNSAPLLYRIKNINAADLIVRFQVIGIDGESRTWLIKELRDNFVNYISSKTSKTAMCYVLGKELPYTENHPKKIINTNANAKLISANDTENFTFRGRFHDKYEAVCISTEVSQKVHAALRWLVDTRGIKCGTQVILAFSSKSAEIIPDPIISNGLFEDDPGEETEITSTKLEKKDTETNKKYAERLKNTIYGQKWHDFDKKAPVTVMILDCATTGKISITFYREMKFGEYMERIKEWHDNCNWLHNYLKKPRCGTPSFYDICDAVYGKKVNEKVKKQFYERLMPCVLDGAVLPNDFVHNSVKRAMRPESFDEKIQWLKTLVTACALLNKKYKEKNKEGVNVALDENRTDRDYLYGRLLAVADYVEYCILQDMKANRQTNAMRYMNAMSQNPFRIWYIIEKQIRPYMAKFENRGNYYYKNLISEIGAKIEGDENSLSKPLNGMFLIGYHNQHNNLINKENKK